MLHRTQKVYSPLEWNTIRTHFSEVNPMTYSAQIFSHLPYSLPPRVSLWFPQLSPFRCLNQVPVESHSWARARGVTHVPCAAAHGASLRGTGSPDPSGAPTIMARLHFLAWASFLPCLHLEGSCCPRDGTHPSVTPGRPSFLSPGVSLRSLLIAIGTCLS